MNSYIPICSFFLQGKGFTGTSRTYKAESDDLHVTFQERQIDDLFDDRVNSAICTCPSGNTIYGINVKK